MHICVWKTANFSPAFSDRKGWKLLMMNRSSNTVGTNEAGQIPQSQRPFHLGLELQSIFSSFLEPGDEPALPRWKLNISTPPLQGLPLKWMWLICVCGYVNPLSLTV